MENRFIYKSTGQYLGFIQNNYFYSRDGFYLGWVEGNYVWDATGKFSGIVIEVNGHNYIWINRFALLPVPRPAKPLPTPVIPPTPPSAFVTPISLPVGYADGF